MRYPVILGSLLCILACGEEPTVDTGDLTGIPFSPTSYTLVRPAGYPQFEIPADNPTTVEGVMLGRKLFFDPILSIDSTKSCSSCHNPQSSFTDGLSVSEGVGGAIGRRSAMSLVDAAFHFNGLFWDGRSASLEDQALLPVEDHAELMESWPNVELKLQQHPQYPREFRQAFGINNTTDISKEYVVKAIAQFERILVSSGQSKFDRRMRGEVFFSDSEYNGFAMFFDDDVDVPRAECFHCHAPPLFTINEYRNNGIEPVQGLFAFPDKGRGEVTGDTLDNGKFKIPTLRNIEYTAPYMHDGRFATLEEVLDHYNSGGHRQPNTDPFIYNLGLSPQQKQDIIAFLKTLSDTTFLQNPEFQSPF